MAKLKLTAGIESSNEYHAWIGVFQNGGKAGSLVVEKEHVAEALAILNAGAEMVAACKEMQRALTCPTRELLDSTRDEMRPLIPLLKAAIAKYNSGARMKTKRTFLTRFEAANKLGLVDAVTNLQTAKSCGTKLAITVGGVIREAKPGETLHAQIALRVIQEGCLGPYREGWTVDESEVTA